MNRISRFFLQFPIKGWRGKMLNIVNFRLFMEYSFWYYKKIGIKMNGRPCYISPDVYFDSADFSSITLGENITISREVMFLVHDYSIHIPMMEVGWSAPKGKTAHFIKSITIGDNSFIGARVSLLPGTSIGKNCIIGSCAVVKGVIPDNSIVIGNPAQIVGNTNEWAKKHLSLGDWRL